MVGGGGSTVAQTVASTLAAGLRRTASHWRILTFGQGLAFLLASSGAASATLALECRISLPAFQNLWIYVALAFHAGVALALRDWGEEGVEEDEVGGKGFAAEVDVGGGGEGRSRSTKAVRWLRGGPSSKSSSSSSTPNCAIPSGGRRGEWGSNFHPNPHPVVVIRDEHDDDDDDDWDCTVCIS